MSKWLKTEFKNQRQGELVLTLIIGLLVGFVVGGISSDWAIVKGAKWWEIMTAFGTVGAVLYALFSDRYKRAEQAKVNRAVSQLAVGMMIPQLRSMSKQLRESFQNSLLEEEESGGMRNFHMFMPEYEKINLHFNKELLFLLNNTGNPLSKRLVLALGELELFMVAVREFGCPSLFDQMVEKEGLAYIVDSKEMDRVSSIIWEIDNIANEAEAILRDG